MPPLNGLLVLVNELKLCNLLGGWPTPKKMSNSFLRKTVFGQVGTCQLISPQTI